MEGDVQKVKELIEDELQKSNPGDGKTKIVLRRLLTRIDTELKSTELSSMIKNLETEEKNRQEQLKLLNIENIFDK